LRVRAPSAIQGSLSVLVSAATVLASAAAPALASSTGGVAAGGNVATSTAGASSPTRPAAPIHLSPITSRSTRLAYHGPVYEKTATGEIVPYLPAGLPGQVRGATGGSPVGVAAATRPQLLVPGSLARYVNGLAAAPMSAPAAVQEALWAGNQIIGLPYIFGGGHGSFDSPGYDCSGTVSFALHGGSLLSTPEDSSELELWGSHGVGRWITIFANPGHAYMAVAGLRLDTSAASDPSNQQGPRWRPLRPSNGGYTIRHPLGL
jgi:cell wall-associated NlpC family hydrolase